MEHYRSQIETSVPSAEELRRLATQWNAALPVSRLPPETLAAIFVEYATATRAEYCKSVTPRKPEQQWTLFSWNTRPYSWIRVTHVCQLWRDIALQYPRLWNWITKAPTPLIQLLLQRSGQIPLFIDTRLSPPSMRIEPCGGWSGPRRIPPTPLPPSPFPDVVYENWHRIQEAKIDVSTTSLEDICAPALRVLEVHKVHPSGLDRNTPLLLPNDLSSLRSLSWYAPCGKWDQICPLFSRQLEVLRVHGGQTASLDSWISAVRSMPRLHTLSLKGAIHDTGYPQPPLHSVVAVRPCLKDLVLSTMDRDNDVQMHPPETSLLASLNLSRHANIQYEIRSNLFDADIHTLLASLPTRINDAEELTLTIPDGPTTFDWAFSSHTAPNDGLTSGDSCPRHPTIVLQAKCSLPSITIARLSSALPWPTVTHMRLRFMKVRGKRSSMVREKGREVCAAAFRTLVNLTVLVVEGQNVVIPFLVALEQLTSERDSDSAADNPLECPLPNLRECTFDGELWRVGLPENEPLSLLVVRLTTTFLARQARGAPLHTLRIKNARCIRVEDVEYIRAQNCTDVVQWDAER
ncbi:hypothetical protein NM688_g2196 [Phlebia brevispora]|uniref:Uncharacterized protein n=1 Tax=Phlebia brevispora TaxID=194682 RepID=A0ACC1T9A4_9APHY|nr:hypothetical protein NM688_g2196 [Phlebia brevispora]